jgi:hypothetical protein
MRVLVPIDIKDARHDSQKVVVSSTSLSSLYSVPTSSFRSLKLVVQTVMGTDYSVREFLAIHNGTDGFLTEYAIVSTNESSAFMGDSFSANVSGANFHFYVTPATSTSRTFTISVVTQ